jgi:hypothetical protein
VIHQRCQKMRHRSLDKPTMIPEPTAVGAVRSAPHHEPAVSRSRGIFTLDHMSTLPVISILVAGILCGCSDSSTPQKPPATMSESKPSDGTVESLLATVAGITNGQTSFELFVPDQVTLKGEAIRQDAAMAVVLDKILGHDLFPAGFEERTGGRLYKYRKERL